MKNVRIVDLEDDTLDVEHVTDTLYLTARTMPGGHLDSIIVLDAEKVRTLRDVCEAFLAAQPR